VSADDRFWSKVEKGSPTQCWLWTGGKQHSGHGRFRVDKDRPSVAAHSFSLELASGSKPDDLYCLHRCDNPPCVNPAHLYWGTPKQNMDDMWARGRNFRGEDRAHSKLTAEQVVAMRQANAAGWTCTDLSKEYGVCVKTVSDIVRGVMWAHVGGPIRTKAKPGKPKGYARIVQADRSAA
jgi:hypothetical protein